MIDDLTFFTSKALNTALPREMYSDGYVKYLTSLVVYQSNIDNEEINPYILYDILSNYYPDNCFKKSPFLKQYNGGYRQSIKLTVSEKKQISTTRTIMALISQNKEKDYKELFEDLISLLACDTDSMDSTRIISILLTIRFKEKEMPLEYLGFKSYVFQIHLVETINQLKATIDNISPKNYGLSTKTLTDNDNLKDLLWYLDLETIEDVISYGEKKASYFCLLDDEFINRLHSKSEDCITAITRIIETRIEGLPERERQIIELRNGIGYEKQYTLEETGTMFNLTRERIRQLEKKALRKLQYKVQEIEPYVQDFIDTHSNGLYLDESVITSSIKNDRIVEYLKLLLKIDSTSRVKYVPEWKIMCNNDLNIQKLVEETANQFGTIVTKNEKEECDLFTQTVIERQYRLFKGNYLLRGLANTSMLVEIVDTYLPEGYHNGNEEDFQFIQRKGKEKYGDEFDYLSERAMMAALVRGGYILVDSGIYRNKEKCPRIPDVLLTDILQFVEEGLPIVFYTGIYERFKESLSSIGINNHYFLKGILDPMLPSEYSTNRDYISGEKGLTSWQAILNVLSSFEGVFTFKQVKDHFPTTKDYVINSVIAYENNRGLLSLQNKRFIYFEKTGITDETKKELKSFIDEMFVQNNTTFLSAQKIYARLRMRNKTLLNKMAIVEGYYDLFSLIQSLFNEEYYMRRPFISVSENQSLDSEEIIINYVSQLDSFDSKVVKDYVTSTNMRGLYSYLNFIDTLSDEYVQVDADKLIKKEALQISQDMIKETGKSVSLILDYSPNIDTRIFSGFGMLPNIGTKWNKYLLVGIIRSYFSEDYVIENTTNMWHTTDFIIRRNEDE